MLTWAFEVIIEKGRNRDCTTVLHTLFGQMIQTCLLWLFIKCFCLKLCKWMVAGVSGTPGVSVPSQLVVYKPDGENAPIQNQHMVGNTAMGPEHCWENVATCPVAKKVTYKLQLFWFQWMKTSLLKQKRTITGIKVRIRTNEWNCWVWTLIT